MTQKTQKIKCRICKKNEADFNEVICKKCNEEVEDYLKKQKK